MASNRLLGSTFAATVAALALALAAVPAALAQTGGPDATGRGARSPPGRVLVDRKGIALYDFAPDRGGRSVCYGACAALWPPLLTQGKPVAGPGVRASLLGTTRRSDGKL